MLSLDHFEKYGFTKLESCVDESLCDQIKKKVLESRNFDNKIFLDKLIFEQENPNAFNKNPRPGFNYADKLNDLILIIQKNTKITEFLNKLLDSNYDIFRRKFVCGVSSKWLPVWIKNIIKNDPSANLAHFVKKKHTDITWFHGIDFHQDLIDWQNHQPNFITLYVYLEDVKIDMAPIFLLPKSHKLGPAIFPHNCKLVDKKKGIWSYKNPISKKVLRAKQNIQLAKKGTVFIWHALTLHGTQAAKSIIPRVSLRYLIRTNSRNSFLNKMNKMIGEDLSLSSLRKDLDKKGIAKSKDNKINFYKLY